jgi:hypothetical protein
MAFRTQARYTASLALYLLKTLQLQKDQRAWLSLDELVESATAAMRDEGATEVLRLFDESLFEFCRNIMGDFAELGLVETDRESTTPRYRAPPPGGNEPPSELIEGDGPNEGDSGMGEILAHPILFSAPEEVFDAAIQRALEQY